MDTEGVPCAHALLPARAGLPHELCPGLLSPSPQGTVCTPDHGGDGSCPWPSVHIAFFAGTCVHHGSVAASGPQQSEASCVPSLTICLSVVLSLPCLLAQCLSFLPYSQTLP